MSSQITRVFHLVHPSGSVFEIYNEQTRSSSFVSIQSREIDELQTVIPTLSNLADLRFGFRNARLVNTTVDVNSEKVELYIVLVNANNSVRSRPMFDNGVGRWTSPDKMLSSVDPVSKLYSDIYCANGSWTFDDFVKNTLHL